jgi:hypothetical protein
VLGPHFIGGLRPTFGPHDVGHRVVIRRVVGTRDDRPLFTDILGELVAWDEHTVTVVTRRGEIIVPRNEIARAKRIPPRAPASDARHPAGGGRPAGGEDPASGGRPAGA